MPVKSGAPARRKSGSGRSKIVRAKPQPERAAIKNLVKDIPALILKDGYRAEAKAPEPVAIHIDVKKRQWLWTGVALCTLFIFGFWLINVRTMFLNTFGKRDPEQQIFQTTQQDFQALLDRLMINNSKLDHLKASFSTSTPVETTTTRDDALRAGLTELLLATTTSTLNSSTPGHFPVASTTKNTQ